MIAEALWDYIFFILIMSEDAVISAMQAMQFYLLTADSISAKSLLKKGFMILQFNAVVETNTHARHLYERIGFRQLGVIPKGFRMKDGHYENICPYYIML